MNIILLLTGIFIIALGIIIKDFKNYSLIAGYNTMSKQEKEKYDIEKFATLMRNVFLICGVLFFLFYILSFWGSNYFIVFIPFGILVIGAFYLVSQGNKYKKSNL